MLKAMIERFYVMKDDYLFTSESVTEGHPDKMADQIADAILDELIRKEKALQDAGVIGDDGKPVDVSNLRCACEVMLTTGTVFVAGEIRSQCYVDVQQVVRDTVRRIGYDRAKYGFDCDTCGVITALHEQSPDIAQGVDESDAEKAGSTDPYDEFGAGDQGMMFGYATNETDVLMPMPHYIATRLSERLAAVRHDGTLSYLRPDGKTQVTVRYVDDKPYEVTAIVVSTQHAPEVVMVGDDPMAAVRADIIEHVITPVMDEIGIKWDNAKIYVNPTGRFVVGGPQADTSVSGRKVIVDTYGGMGRHGGGAFSTKDPTKVDRSAAYAARWVAKNVVAAGLADRCEVQVSYAIGVAKPLSIMIDTFGTEHVDCGLIERAVNETFDLRPAAIIDQLDLWRPIYEKTAAYGHFGRELPEFTWERCDRVDELRRACGLS